MIGDLIHVRGELCEVVAESRMTLPVVETIAERRARMEAGGKAAPKEFGFGILRVRPVNPVAMAPTARERALAAAGIGQPCSGPS